MDGRRRYVRGPLMKSEVETEFKHHRRYVRSIRAIAVEIWKSFNLE
jgi:hypothetical protein